MNGKVEEQSRHLAEVDCPPAAHTRGDSRVRVLFHCHQTRVDPIESSSNKKKIEMECFTGQVMHCPCVHLVASPHQSIPSLPASNIPPYSSSIVAPLRHEIPKGTILFKLELVVN